MEELLGILKYIIDLDFKPENKLPLIERIAHIYENKDFRHSYYELSLFLQSITEEERDTVSGNLDLILVYVNNARAFKCNELLCRGIFKLADHINLDTLRLNRLKGLEFIGQKAEEDLRKAEELNNENSRNVEELRDKVSKFHGQSITVLGIFSGLVIGFATGSNLLMETFTNINELNISSMLLYILLIGFVLFDMIFMLMYCVSKISGTSIAVTCKNKYCERCNTHKWFITRFIHKYPYAFFFNVIIIVLVALILVFKYNSIL